MTDASEDDAEVARLRAERDELQAEVERLAQRPARRETVRRTGVAVLVVVACLAFAISVPGIWARRNFLDTDRFVDRAAPLIEDPAVQTAVSARLTEQLLILIDPRELFEEVLPERGRLLAVPLSSAVSDFIADRVDRFVASDTFAELWEAAVRFAHQSSVQVLDGGGEVVSTADGRVTLNLIPVINAILLEITSLSPEILGREIDIPDVTIEDVPEVAIARLEEALDIDLGDEFGLVTVYEDDKLGAVQDAVELFDRIVVVLLPLSVVLAALALWLSHRRRRTLLQLTIGVTLAMVVLRRIAFALEDEVAALPPRAEGQAAAAVVIGTFLEPLTTFAVWSLAIALAVAVVAAVTGPYPWAVSLRRRVQSVGSGLVSATTSKVHDDATVTWVRDHRDALLGAGVVVGVVVLWTADVSWAGLLLLLGAVAAFEAAVYRIGAPVPPPPEQGISP